MSAALHEAALAKGGLDRVSRQGSLDRCGVGRPVRHAVRRRRLPSGSGGATLLLTSGGGEARRDGAGPGAGVGRPTQVLWRWRSPRRLTSSWSAFRQSGMPGEVAAFRGARPMRAFQLGKLASAASAATALPEFLPLRLRRIPRGRCAPRNTALAVCRCASPFGCGWPPLPTPHVAHGRPRSRPRATEGGKP